MDIENSIVIQIKALSLELDRLGNQMLSPLGLTYPQFKTLKFLLWNPPGTVRQMDIEKHFCLTNPTVTGILKNLEKKGLIERTANHEDRRSKIIFLTEKGKSMEKTLTGVGGEMEKRAVANLSEEEKEQLICLLKKCRESRE